MKYRIVAHPGVQIESIKITRNNYIVELGDTVPKSSDFDKHHICIFYGFTPMLF